MNDKAHVRPNDETFYAKPHQAQTNIIEKERDVFVTREEVERGCYLLRRVMSPRECRALIEAAGSLGFTHSGLAVGDDLYRVNLAVRNNLRVVIDDLALSSALWLRMKSCVDLQYEGSSVVGLNWRFRVYQYSQGQRFFPHVDVRTPLRNGTTLFSVVIYLNDRFEGGETRFYEKKDKASRRGEGRGRKFNNRLKYALRPAPGDAVVFDHLLLHEGSEVTSGVKYAVRSDLIYQLR